MCRRSSEPRDWTGRVAEPRDPRAYGLAASEAGGGRECGCGGVADGAGFSRNSAGRGAGELSVHPATGRRALRRSQRGGPAGRGGGGRGEHPWAALLPFREIYGQAGQGPGVRQAGSHRGAGPGSRGGEVGAGWASRRTSRACALGVAAEREGTVHVRPSPSAPGHLRSPGSLQSPRHILRP